MKFDHDKSSPGGLTFEADDLRKTLPAGCERSSVFDCIGTLTQLEGRAPTRLQLVSSASDTKIAVFVTFPLQML